MTKKTNFIINNFLHFLYVLYFAYESLRSTKIFLKIIHIESYLETVF